MANPYSDWGSGNSSTAFGDWGLAQPKYHYGGSTKSSGGGGGNSSLWPDIFSNNPVSEAVGHAGDYVSHVLPGGEIARRFFVGPHQLVDFATHDFIAGLATLGKATVTDLKNEALFRTSHKGYHPELLSIAEGYGKGYYQKYGKGLLPRDWTNPASEQFWLGRNPTQTAHNIAQDPFGTFLDFTVLSKAAGAAHLRQLEKLDAAGRIKPGSWQERAVAKTREIHAAPGFDIQDNPYRASGGSGLGVRVSKLFRAKTTQGRLMQSYIDDLRTRMDKRFPNLPGSARRLAIRESMQIVHQAFQRNEALTRAADEAVSKLPRSLQNGLTHTGYLPRSRALGGADPIGKETELMREELAKLEKQAERTGRINKPRLRVRLQIRALKHKLAVLEGLNHPDVKAVIYGTSTDHELQALWDEAYSLTKRASDAVEQSMVENHLATPEEIAARKTLIPRLLGDTRYGEKGLQQDILGSYDGLTHEQALGLEQAAIDSYNRAAQLGGDPALLAELQNLRAQLDTEAAKGVGADTATLNRLSLQIGNVERKLRPPGGTIEVGTVQARPTGEGYRFTLSESIAPHETSPTIGVLKIEPDGFAYITALHARDLLTEHRTLPHDLLEAIFKAMEQENVTQLVPDPGGMTADGLRVWNAMARRIQQGRYPDWSVKGTLETMQSEKAPSLRDLLETPGAFYGPVETFGGQSFERVSTPIDAHNPLARYGPAMNVPHHMVGGPMATMERVMYHLPGTEKRSPSDIMATIDNTPGAAYLSGLLNDNPEVFSVAHLKHWHEIRRHDLFEQLVVPMSGRLEARYAAHGGRANGDQFIFTKPEETGTRGDLWDHKLPQGLDAPRKGESPEQWINRLDQMGVRRVRGSLIKKWEKEVDTTKNILQKLTRPVNQIWRFLLLTIKPSWALMNTATNDALVLLKNAGRGGIRAYLSLVKETRGVRALRKLKVNTLHYNLSPAEKSIAVSEINDTIHGVVKEYMPEVHAGEWSRTPFLDPARQGEAAGPAQLPLVPGTESVRWRSPVKTLKQMKPGGYLYKTLTAGLHHPGIASRRIAHIALALPRAVERINVAGEGFARDTALVAKVYQMTGKMAKNAEDLRSILDEHGYTAGSEKMRDLIFGPNGPIDVLGDYSRMSAAERRLITPIVPFYPWYKTILGITAKFFARDPERVWILHTLAMATAAVAQQDFQLGVPVPSFGQDLQPLLGPEKGGRYQLTLSTRGWNPFQTPVDIGRNVESFLTAGPGAATPNQIGLGLFGPIPQGAYTAFTGQDPFYGGTYRGWGAGKGGFGRAIGSQFGGIPILRTEAQVTGGYKSKVFAAPSQRDQAIVGILQYLGLPVKYVDLHNMRTRALEEQGVVSSGGGSSYNYNPNSNAFSNWGSP